MPPYRNPGYSQGQEAKANDWLSRPMTQPRDFVRATWHGTTSVLRTGDEIGFTVDTTEGKKRYLLRVEDARHLAESLLEQLDAERDGK